MLLTVQAQSSRARGRRMRIVRLQRWRLSLQGAPWLQRACACGAAELTATPAPSMHCLTRPRVLMMLHGMGAHRLHIKHLSLRPCLQQFEVCTLHKKPHHARRWRCMLGRVGQMAHLPAILAAPRTLCDRQCRYLRPCHQSPQT